MGAQKNGWVDSNTQFVKGGLEMRISLIIGFEKPMGAGRGGVRRAGRWPQVDSKFPRT